MTRTLSILIILAVFLAAASLVLAQGEIGPQAALGAAFTYQGQLKNGSGPVNGNCDFQFSLWDSLSNSTGQIGAAVSRPNVAVSDGLFTVSLDFGTSAFTGSERWLQIEVRCPAGSGSYVTLTPRQPLTAAPYALFSSSTGRLQGRPISTTAPTAGQVLKWNGTAWSPGVDSVGAGGDHTHWGASWSGSGTGLSLSGGTVGLVASGQTTGTVGIATNGSGVTYGVYGQANSDGGYGVYGYNPSGDGVYGESSDPDFVGVRGYNSSGGEGVEGSSPSGYGVSGYSYSGVGMYGQSSYGDGVYGSSSSSGYGVRGYSSSGRGVYGYSSSGMGVYGSSYSSTGVYGYSSIGYAGVSGYNSSNGYGVRGSSSSGAGVYGYSLSGYGVRGYSSSSYAGYFDGNVHVNGSLSKSGGSFKIDHPLDPANRTLSHSFVESPDMMNIYNGNATLDARGEAVVDLPAWFEVLNEEFRYQLTPIGGPGPGLYIAQEIKDHRFKIGGGSAGLKVSWQVTGIRHDPWAEAHRIQVEEDKPIAERGTYLYPQGYGQPETKGVNYDKEAELRQAAPPEPGPLPDQK